MEDIKDKLVPISTSGGPMHVIAPLMPSQDTTPDQIAFFNRPNSIPYVRHSPLPVAASAQTNAVAKTIAKEVFASTPAVPAAATQVDLTMPVQYTVTETTSGSNEGIDVAWVPVPAGWALMGPGPISSIQAIGENSTSGSSVIVSVTPPSSSPSWGLFVEFSNNNLTGAPSGWTLINSSSSQNVYYQASPTGAVLSVNEALSAATNYASAILLFTGTIPAIVQSKAGTLTGASGTISLAGALTAGNVLIIILQAYNGSAILNFTASDSLNNHIFPVATETMAASSDPSVSQTTFIAQNVTGGSDTISWTIGGVRSAPNHQEYLLLELGPLTPGSGLPFFQPITAFNLPDIQELSGNLPYSALSGVLAQATLTAAAPTVTAGQVGIGNGTSTSATTGANGAVPAQVVGYLTINVAGTDMKIPYFNV